MLFSSGRLLRLLKRLDIFSSVQPPRASSFSLKNVRSFVEKFRRTFSLPSLFVAMASRRIISSMRSSRFHFIASLSTVPPSKIPPDRLPHAFSLASFCLSSALPPASAATPAPPCTQTPDSPHRLLHHDTSKLLKTELHAFTSQLLALGPECMSLGNFAEACKQQGMAASNSEATNLAIKLDQSGLLLLFHNYVFLRPDKVAQDFSKALPFSLSPLEDDAREEEFSRLQKEREEIDKVARTQVRRLLWTAFGGFTVQSIVFFRLTFWDLSWDVMEPITFFTTSSTLLAGFFFFVLTSRDPSYKDIMHTILSSRTRKLMKKRNFDTERFRELQMYCYPNTPRLRSKDHL